MFYTTKKQWLYNVLEGKTEADRVVLKDEDAQNGFVLLEDLKWDAKQTTNLYLVAICMRRDLLSIRSLRGCHVPILEQIRDRCKVCLFILFFNFNYLRNFQ